jgi:hypothetical protein
MQRNCRDSFFSQRSGVIAAFGDGADEPPDQMLNAEM